eukprot:TRINITY_DN2755_c0_g1_i2.p1 TRINITY_DN2755_c0_g1~~TRINITY_DN2755_c0_g1_i2.p1  ORF type:complete len:350 (+),score=67.27 TRINITY_DN2755_c0_g1_i2:70-1050(+)
MHPVAARACFAAVWLLPAWASAAAPCAAGELQRCRASCPPTPSWKHWCKQTCASCDLTGRPRPPSPPTPPGGGVAARVLLPSGSTPRVSQKFILDCDPPAVCSLPARNNEPCKSVPVPFFQHPPLRLTPAVRLGPGHPDGTGGVFADNMLRRDIIDALESAGAFPRHFAVNFGAWLQSSTQPLWYDTATGVMLRRGWAGMAFDSEEHLQILRQRVEQEGRKNNITLHPVLLSAENVVSYLEKNADPEDLRQMGFLKVDVDSIDCDLAEAILRAGYRPVMLHRVRPPLARRAPRHLPQQPAGIRLLLRRCCGARPPLRLPPCVRLWH